MKHLYPKSKDELKEAVEEASRVLSLGGIVIYPTDTVYGIGADATNELAVGNVFKVKSRDGIKPLSIIVRDKHMAKEYVDLNPLAEKIVDRVLPGPLTLVLKKTGNVAPNVTSGKSTLGLRIPDSFFCIALAAEFGRAYTTTSANLSGRKAGNIDEILSQLNEHHDLIDLIIDVGPLNTKPPSTVLDVSDGESVTVLREGEFNLHALQHVTLKDVS